VIKDILKEQGLIIYIEIHLPSFKYKETRYLSGYKGQKYHSEEWTIIYKRLFKTNPCPLYRKPTYYGGFFCEYYWL